MSAAKHAASAEPPGPTERGRRWRCRRGPMQPNAPPNAPCTLVGSEKVQSPSADCFASRKVLISMACAGEDTKTVRVHVIQTGQLASKEAVFRSRSRLGIATAFVRGGWFKFPVYAYVVEHDDGHLVIDTGAGHRMPAFPGVFKVFVEENDEI